MSVINATPLLAAAGGDYQISRSVRLRSSASAYFNRTFSSGANETTSTLSLWVKRGKIGAQQTLMGVAGGGSNEADLFFDGGDTLTFASWNGGSRPLGTITTSAVYRDPSAWYHIVFVVDTSNATASNRLRLYVNGFLQTIASSSYPAQNAAWYWNGAYAHRIGAYANTLGAYLDGYLTEVNFIDGQALTPSSFGAFSIYNQWLPKKYAGTYGTNGFYLPFTNNASAATLGNDFSGNGNTWTTNNISVTTGSTYDSMTDVPTLTSATAANFAVLNAVDIGYSAVLSEANLKVSTASSGNAVASSTMAMTGNTYWEVTVGSNSQFGLIWGPASDAFGNSNLSMFTSGAAGSLVNATRTLSATPSWSNGDTLGFAWSSSARTLTLYQAGSATAVMTMTTPTTGDPMIAITNNTSGAAMSSFLNCGQRPFTYTPPSGYLALNTFNL